MQIHDKINDLLLLRQYRLIKFFAIPPYTLIPISNFTLKTIPIALKTILLLFHLQRRNNYLDTSIATITLRYYNEFLIPQCISTRIYNRHQESLL